MRYPITSARASWKSSTNGLSSRSSPFEAYRPFPRVPYGVIYKGHPIGEYVADLVVDDRLLVELKCAHRLADEHLAQCINYLTASGLHLALLLNFQHPKVEWCRVVQGL